jgi:hypothetical protein
MSTRGSSVVAALFWIVVVIFIGWCTLGGSGKTSASQDSTSENDSTYADPYDDQADNSYTDDEEEVNTCNDNYSGCVEDSSYDLDCSDIGEEVEVIGYDEYNLDRDGDGYGCESY